MTDYLELLLAELEMQEETGTVLRLPRRGRVIGQSKDIDLPEQQTASEVKRAGETPELLPEEGNSFSSEEGRTTRAMLYREMDRARETLRRREQTMRRAEEETARRDQSAAAQSQAWNTWDRLPAAQAQVRYAALVDAEFQRDARRYDGALGLL